MKKTTKDLCLFCVKDATKECYKNHRDWISSWKDCIKGYAK